MTPTKRTRTLTLPALALALLVAGTAASDPASVSPTGPASAEYVAVSATGNAHCTYATCVAVTVTGTATSGCSEVTCEVTECIDFVCGNVAASVLGTADGNAYCRIFGSVCFWVTVGQQTVVYVCYTDINDNSFCRGAG